MVTSLGPTNRVALGTQRGTRSENIVTSASWLGRNLPIGNGGLERVTASFALRAELRFS